MRTKKECKHEYRQVNEKTLYEWVFYCIKCLECRSVLKEYPEQNKKLAEYKV